jgi:curved DNA-binding protein CbpA
MTTPEQNPFEALGLPARPDLDDEQVRAAWRAIAAATHPDRPDGGDLAAYTAASAAYAELRTPWARSEAYADLADRATRAGQDPDTSPIPVIRDPAPAPPPPPTSSASRCGSC